MWTKLLLALVLAGVFAQAKEEGKELNLGKVEETRWSSKVVGKNHMPIELILLQFFNIFVSHMKRDITFFKIKMN